MRWDRPCTPHKIDGVHCQSCNYYDQVVGRLLIVKLDALGDVLRTTCILPALREKFPKARISWITAPASVPLLENIPSLDRVIPAGMEAVAVLKTERFDIVFGLDTAPRSAALASLAKAVERKGFGVDPGGRVFPYNAEANDWFTMGLFDDVKKKNKRTYQDIIMEICDLKGLRQDIVVALTEKEKAHARRFAEEAGLRVGGARPGRIIGVNTGSGSRWPMKQWPIGHTIELIGKLLAEGDARVLLFGGREEEERNRLIRESVGGGLIDTGCRNSLREFMALVDLCDLLVTGDTMALHVALGLGKKVVALFGPTSAAEIDVYGRGIKITPRMDCVCCYLRECDKKPTCMERISVDTVLRGVKELLGRTDATPPIA